MTTDTTFSPRVAVIAQQDSIDPRPAEAAETAENEPAGVQAGWTTAIRFGTFFGHTQAISSILGDRRTAHAHFAARR